MLFENMGYQEYIYDCGLISRRKIRVSGHSDPLLCSPPKVFVCWLVDYRVFVNRFSCETIFKAADFLGEIVFPKLLFLLF